MADEWDYFRKDPAYSTILRDRLAHGVEMDSAKALAEYVSLRCDGDLNIVDFGAGPGHYYPVLKSRYAKGGLRYLGIDIDAANIEFGAAHFASDPNVTLRVGSVLEPGASIPPDANCVMSANTLPHVPTIEPLLHELRDRPAIRFFVFRMLLGNECVQIKKHLKEHEFDHMYERDYQLNNIYSAAYLQHHLGPSWRLQVEPDVFDAERLAQHQIPAQEHDPFYANRVSRPVGSMVFKGDVFMPWKFAIGSRAA